MGYIYKITNIINGKLYIGQTTLPTVEDRFKVHIKNAENHINRYLYDAMNHYGYENFKITQIEECENSLLNEREIYYIAYYHTFVGDPESNGYNMTTGGDGGNTWQANKHKEDTSKKISAKNKNKTVSLETRKKLKDAGIIRAEKHFESRLNTLPYKGIIEDLKNSSLPIYKIAENFKVKITDIQFITRYLYNCSPQKLRTSRIKNAQYCIPDREAYLKNHNKFGTGQENPLYKEITNWDEVFSYLLTDLKLTDIAKKLNISAPTLSQKIKEHYNIKEKTIKEFRNNVKQEQRKRISLFS